MSATLLDIARKYSKPLDEVRRALPRVGFDTRNISAVAAIPQDIEQKLEALWLSEIKAAAPPPPESRPAKKPVIGGAEITSRKRRQIARPPRPLPPKQGEFPAPAVPPTSGAVFDGVSLAERYAFLDDCPDHLLGDVIASPVGDLHERVAGVVAWRKALLEGRLPPQGEWPPEAIDAPVRRALEALGLARFCRDQPELVDEVVRNILAAWNRQFLQYESELAEVFRELRKTEILARRKMRRGARSPKFTDAELRAIAARRASGRARPDDAELLSAWKERVRVWGEVADIFGDLGALLGRGWDLSQGVLRQTGWLEVVKVSRMLKQLPQLRDIIRTLGRLQAGRDGESVSEKVMNPVRRLEEELREVRAPLVPTEARGVERSGDIGRMLPAEAAMLGHPKMKTLWHARRAERALLSYHYEGLDWERRLVEKESMEEGEKKVPRPERGPIVLAVDTSGSMQGPPEIVAKAVALEAMRVAHAEKRRCFVYAWSAGAAPAEHELSLDPEGVGKLIEFLGFSFHGGSDPVPVVSRVLDKLRESEWKRADVLVVSDGEWPVGNDLPARIAESRERGTRFHGVQVGASGKSGLHEICDPVHLFGNWNELAEGR